MNIPLIISQGACPVVNSIRQVQSRVLLPQTTEVFIMKTKFQVQMRCEQKKERKLWYGCHNKNISNKQTSNNRNYSTQKYLLKTTYWVQCHHLYDHHQQYHHHHHHHYLLDCSMTVTFWQDYFPLHLHLPHHLLQWVPASYWQAKRKASQVWKCPREIKNYSTNNY